LWGSTKRLECFIICDWQLWQCFSWDRKLSTHGWKLSTKINNPFKNSEHQINDMNIVVEICPGHDHLGPLKITKNHGPRRWCPVVRISPLRKITCHGIRHCYMPPGSGDSPAFSPCSRSWYLAPPQGCKSELIWDLCSLRSRPTSCVCSILGLVKLWLKRLKIRKGV